MTEQSIPELIAEARANVERAADAATGKQAERIRAGEVSDDRLRLLVQLADALEAEHERAGDGWRIAAVQARLGRGRAERAEAERDAAYAVIEQVRSRLAQPMHPYGDKRIPQIPERDFLADAYGPGIVDDFDAIFATVPAEALRGVKAEAARDALLKEADALERYTHMFTPDGGVCLSDIVRVIRRDAGLSASNYREGADR